MGIFSSRAEKKRQRRASLTRASKKPYVTTRAPSSVTPEILRARRRLVGAITLLLAAAIVLPLVFKLTPTPSDQVQLLIIDQPQALQNTTQKNDTPESLTKFSGTISPKKNVTENLSPHFSAPMPNPSNLSSPKNPSKPDSRIQSSQNTARNSVQPRAQAKNNATKPRNHYIIKIGAFSSTQRAQNWLNKLNAANINVYLEFSTQKNNQTLFLLRAGPFTRKKEAEIAAQKIRKMGLSTYIHQIKKP